MATLDSKSDIAMVILLIVAIIVVTLAIIDRIQIRRKLKMLTVDTPTKFRGRAFRGDTGKFDYVILKWNTCKGAAKYRIFASYKANDKIIDCPLSFTSETNYLRLPYFGSWYYKVDAINEHRIISYPSAEIKI